MKIIWPYVLTNYIKYILDKFIIKEEQADENAYSESLCV